MTELHNAIWTLEPVANCGAFFIQSSSTAVAVTGISKRFDLEWIESTEDIESGLKVLIGGLLCDCWGALDWEQVSKIAHR